MFTIHTIYVDFSIAVKERQFEDSYKTLDEVKKRICRIRRHAESSATTALKTMNVYDGRDLKYHWTAKTGWKEL
jgi:hypothetical protein